MDQPGIAWTSVDQPEPNEAAWTSLDQSETSLDQPEAAWTSLTQPGRGWPSLDWPGQPLTLDPMHKMVTQDPALSNMKKA